MKLDCAMLFVKDFDRMRAFYAAMLGAGPVNTEWADRWALFDAGGARFALHAIPAESVGMVGVNSSPRPRETAAVKLIFAVENVRSECARLEGLGAAMIAREWQDPDESCDAVDPEGNVFQIAAQRKA